MSAVEPGAPEQLGTAGAHAVHKRIMRGTSWSALSVGGGQVLSLVSVLVLTRLVEPKALGLMTLAWTFLAFVQYAQESGLGAALIYRRGDLERAATTVLLATPVIAVGLCIATIVGAPFAAAAFDQPDLTDVLRVMTGLLLIRSVAVVPRSLLEREMRFGALAASDLGGIVTQIGVSIGLAFVGLEVWSLVFGYLAGGAVQTAIAWALTPWRPSPRQPSWRILREMARYGRFIGGAHIVNLVNRSLDNLVIANALGTTRLAYYGVALKIGSTPPLLFGQIIGRAMFSAYSSIREDLDQVRRVYTDNVQRTALVAIPMGVALALSADTIVRALLPAQWGEATEPLRFLALFGTVRALGATTGEVWSGIGRPHLRLVWEILHAAAVAPVLIVMTWLFGITGTAAGMLIVDSVTAFPAIFLTTRLIALPLPRLLSAVAPTAACVALMGGSLAVLEPTTSSLPAPAGLAVLLAAGFLVYLGSTMVFARTVVTTMWLNFRGARAVG